jgi:hypothetical protein
MKPIVAIKPDRVIRAQNENGTNFEVPFVDLVAFAYAFPFWDDVGEQAFPRVIIDAFFDKTTIVHTGPYFFLCSRQREQFTILEYDPFLVNGQWLSPNSPHWRLANQASSLEKLQFVGYNDIANFAAN